MAKIKILKSHLPPVPKIHRFQDPVASWNPWISDGRFILSERQCTLPRDVRVTDDTRDIDARCREYGQRVYRYEPSGLGVADYQFWHLADPGEGPSPIIGLPWYTESLLGFGDAQPAVYTDGRPDTFAGVFTGEGVCPGMMTCVERRERDVYGLRSASDGVRHWLNITEMYRS